MNMDFIMATFYQAAEYGKSNGNQANNATKLIRNKVLRRTLNANEK